MSKACLVITAVVVEGRKQSEVAASYGVSKGWLSKPVARYRDEGEAAFEPWSRRPKTSPNATPPQVVELIVAFASAAERRRVGRRPGHDRLAPAAHSSGSGRTGHDQPSPDSHDRVRRDRIDDSGVVTLRHAGRLHHIGIGRAHARTHVILLVQDLNIRIVHASTGELLRELILDPTKDYQRQQTRNS
jgi:hypothetical protein